jgi:hypothetical protein
VKIFIQLLAFLLNLFAQKMGIIFNQNKFTLYLHLLIFELLKTLQIKIFLRYITISIPRQKEFKDWIYFRSFFCFPVIFVITRYAKVPDNSKKNVIGLMDAI